MKPKRPEILDAGELTKIFDHLQIQEGAGTGVVEEVIEDNPFDDTIGHRDSAAVIIEPMETGEDKKSKRLWAMAKTLEGKSKDDILLMMAKAELNPLGIIELIKEIEEGKFARKIELHFAIAEIRPQLDFYKEVFEVEAQMAQQKDSQALLASIILDPSPTRIEILRSMVDMYEADIRPDPDNYKERIKTALQQFSALEEGK